MINNVLFIALVVLAVTEVIFAVGFFMMLSKIKKLDSDCKIFKAIMETDRDITNELAKTVGEEAENYEHMYKLCDLIAEQNTKISEQYDNLLKQYKIFYDAFKTINENYKKLLNCWKDVTNACDISSEQFRLCSEELKKVVELRDLIQRVLDPWVLDSDQLGEAVLHGFSHDYTNVNGVIPTEHIWSRADDPRFAYDINNHPGEEDNEEQ